MTKQQTIEQLEAHDAGVLAAEFVENAGTIRSAFYQTGAVEFVDESTAIIEFTSNVGGTWKVTVEHTEEITG